MPRRTIAKPSAATGSVLQLKVRLLGVSPMIWRRLLVESSTTLRHCMA